MGLSVNTIGTSLSSPVTERATKQVRTTPQALTERGAAPVSELPVTVAKEPLPKPRPAAVPPAANEQNREIISKPPLHTNELPGTSRATIQAIKRFVFEHDVISGLSVVKFLDSKGNVVLQVPPEHYLKTVQMLAEFGGVDLAALVRKADQAGATGLLLNKKV